MPDRGDGARLNRRQRLEVLGAHPQPRAVVDRIHQSENALLLGNHRVHGEHLMALAVMRLPVRADAHPHRVDHLLDARPRIPRRVHRQQRAHPLHQVRARARRLVDSGDQAR